MPELVIASMKVIAFSFLNTVKFQAIVANSPKMKNRRFLLSVKAHTSPFISRIIESGIDCSYFDFPDPNNRFERMLVLMPIRGSQNVLVVAYKCDATSD